MNTVVVRAPATVANLGPGFDALGLALAWYDEVRVERHDALEITASGLGAEGVPRDEGNLIVQGMRAALGEVPRARIHRMTSVAFGRGFGSSAASIVAGLVAARALYATGHSDEDLLRLATEIEGHPDNVAPCLLGGIVVCAGDAIQRLDPPPGLAVLVCVAPNRLATEAARAAVPATVARADAVRSISRASLLVAALATGAFDHLLAATEDTLHQPPRFTLMPDTADVVEALRARGVAAFLSGAGPSVSALVPSVDIGSALADARTLLPESWDVRAEALDLGGARVVEQR